MWLYDVLKLMNKYSFVFFCAFWWLFTMSCSFEAYPTTACESHLSETGTLWGIP